jgi:dienelactone hydrolase
MPSKLREERLDRTEASELHGLDDGERSNCEMGKRQHPAIAASEVDAIAPGAEAAKIEVHCFESMTLTDEQFLIGVARPSPVTISGYLRLPPPWGVSTRLPTVVIVHGSGGIMANEDGWSRELNKLGIATFVLDCFTGRGIKETMSDQTQIGLLSPIIDAYRALELLSKHSRIDPERIAVMGCSRGGCVALYASVRRFQRMYAPRGIEFAAYIAFYPPCGTTLIGDEDVSDRPIRLFHGAADNYVPVAPCRSYVQRLQRTGKDVELTEYPSANHLFDNPQFSTVTHLPEAQTARRCSLEEKPLGKIVVKGLDRPFTLDDPCIDRGVDIGYDAEAHSQAKDALKKFFTSVFGLKSLATS